MKRRHGPGSAVLMAQHLGDPRVRFRIEVYSADDEFMKDGLCREVDPELFFKDGRQTSGNYKEAKAVCKLCDVREDCLAYAQDHPNETGHGVWGGLTTVERRALRRAS